MQDKPTPFKRSVPKSTLLLAVMSIFLMAITGAVGWFALQYQPREPMPHVEGTSLQLGLPHEASGAENRTFTAKSALLFDRETKSIVFEQNGFERLPVASLTKLMTAMVALDYGLPLEVEAEILREEYVVGGQLLLHPGEKVTVRDLLAASLVGSANNATLAYIRELGVPPEEFIRQMNRKAIELGLEQTEFTDVTGLNPKNISTAYEVARLADIAFTQYPIIAEFTSMPGYTMTMIGSGREHTVKNSNKLISELGQTLAGSKTGFLYESAYCLVAQGSGEAANRIAVVLGSPSDNEHFADIHRLLALAVP